MFKKLIIMLMALSLLLCGWTLAEGENIQPVVILYTNDVHCGIEEGIGYAGLAAYRDAYGQAGYDVLLADCGDHAQGAAIGTISSGGYIIDIMNEVGYDIATVGNHEFDYGVERFLELRAMAEFPYVACNFTDADGAAVLDAYHIIEAGGLRIAFVGIATPETITSATPAYFMDDEGNFIYGFCRGGEGAELYSAVQSAVDAARSEGADVVIALAHLGIIEGSRPWTSSDVIANTTGIDAVLDGHSHTVLPGEIVLNKDGEPVLLTSTGTRFQYVGALTITPGADGLAIESNLHSETLFQSAETADYIAGIKAGYAEMMNEVVARSDVELIVTDPMNTDENGVRIRLVRRQETNLGDLCADAYRYVTGADIAFSNGGGVRVDVPAGDITYEQVISVHPFSNTILMVEATGQEILDALELSVRALPGEEGSFQQVSGVAFEIDLSVPTSVVMDENGMFVSIDGARRVRNVTVGGKPIDPEATYTLASNSYLLKELGGGFSMFADNTVLQDADIIDSQALIVYIRDALGGVVGEQYADLYGDGRITFVE